MEEGVSVLSLLLHPGPGAGCGRREPRYPSFISTGARATAPGMPSQTLLSLLCFPLLVPRAHPQLFPGCGNPWEEESCSRDQDVRLDHCWESVRAHPKYPSIPQDSREQLIQSHPILWDTPELPWTPQCATAQSLHTSLQHRQLGLCSAEISDGLFSFLSEKTTSFGLIWIEKTIQSL